MDAPKSSVKPVVKWAGGKTKLVDQIARRFPAQYADYHEPFAGGAAVYLALRPTNAFLYDLNPRLVNFYTMLVEHPDQLLDTVRALELEFNSLDFSARKAWHSSIRDRFNYENLAPVESAACFLALNKTSFNGLYRENSKGEFNVPFNKAASRVAFVDETNFAAASSALSESELILGDFSNVLERAGKNSLVYFDPPYVPINPTSSFTKYTSGGFGEREQLRLISVAQELLDRGSHVVISNSSAPWVLDHYQKAGLKFDLVTAKRAISANASGRAPVLEVVAYG